MGAPVAFHFSARAVQTQALTILGNDDGQLARSSDCHGPPTLGYLILYLPWKRAQLLGQGAYGDPKDALSMFLGQFLELRGCGGHYASVWQMNDQGR
jgi:hypothetical protein